MADERTKEELYERAQELDIPYRSEMDKAELAKAVAKAEAKEPKAEEAKAEEPAAAPRDAIQDVLGLEGALEDAVIGAGGDDLKAALLNVLGAISGLKDVLRTRQSLERQERDRGMAA